MEYNLLERMQTVTIAAQKHDRRTPEQQGALDRIENMILDDELRRITEATKRYNEVAQRR